MTKPARITYADVLRTFKALKASRIENARIIMHLEEGEIEVVIGGGKASHELLPDEPNPWDDA